MSTMAATINRAEIDRKMNEHMARWYGVLSSTRTNPTMAVDAINAIYHRLNKLAPAAILWCESPYQMMVIPPLVTNIVQSDHWPKVVQAMKKEAGKTDWQWEAAFETQWEWLKTTCVDRLAKKTIDQRAYDSVSQSTKQAAVERLKAHLRTILVEGKLKPGSMAKKPKDPTADIAAPFCFDFLKHLISVPARIEQRVNLKLEGNSLWMSIWGTFYGVWNPRVIASMMPAIESWLGSNESDEPALKAAADLKSKTLAFERAANQRLRWYFGLFPQPRTEVPDELIRPRAGRTTWEASVETFEAWQEMYRRTQETAKQNPNLTFNLGMYMPCSASWLPFALALRFIKQDFLEAELNDDVDNLAFLSHAAAGYFFCNNVCFACTKPLVMQTTEEALFHNPDGPAVLWSDNLKTYAWKGTIVTPDIIEEKDSVTYRRITEETNAEIRRVMLEIYGESRYLLDSNAKVISEDSCGILYRLDFSNDEPLVMVRVINSTAEPDGSHRSYFLRVPPTIKTAREAVAWTFEMESTEYRPNSQT
jgi:hypothetical protein